MKCNWCQHSRQENNDGKLMCPYTTCQLTKDEIIKIMMLLSKIVIKEKE